ASFIGSPPMNLLPGIADGSRFTMGTGAQSVVLQLPNAAPRAGALVLGLRPEHIEIEAEGRWPLRVETVEMLGAERLVHGRIGGAQGIELFTVRIDATLPPPRVGQAIDMTASPDHLHWFDATTGLRVGA
ncbi:MAG: TOBE domain-containing protein, partial [Aquabacterium sp.]|nr:TOBE domain-containing protein [Aquabacterium sp.]